MINSVGLSAALVAVTLLGFCGMWVVRIINQDGAVKAVRFIAPGLLGGFITGLMGGSLGRLAMRAVTLLAADTPRFSVEGTRSLIYLGIHVSLPLALILLMLRQRDGGTWLRHGAVMGILGVFLVGAPMLLSNQGNEVFGENALIGVPLLLVVFAVCGFVLAGTVEVSSLYLNRRSLMFSALVSVILAVPAVLSVWVFSVITVNNISRAVSLWLLTG